MRFHASWCQQGTYLMADEQEDAAVTVGEEIRCLLAAGWTWNGDTLVHPGHKGSWTMYKRIDFSHKTKLEQFESELKQAVREARQKQGVGK
jgi:hypothetical protein